MKNKTTRVQQACAAILIIATFGGIAAFAALSKPAAPNPPPPVIPQITPQVIPPVAQPVVEVVFALDTTGSMAGLIHTAKEKIWSIASSMAQAQPAPIIRMGIVAYRDRGDDYVTRVIDLSEDMDTVYAQLMDLRAAGGGDHPESVNRALADAVHRISWSKAPNTYRAVFLVGDAPPHSYPNEPNYPAILQAAQSNGIVVNTIQCGTDANTTRVWQQIAAVGQAEFFQVAQSGGSVTVATPFDAKIAQLSADLDSTRLGYGGQKARKRHAEKAAATKKLKATASPAALARRGVYNATASGWNNAVGDTDLFEDVAGGRVKLEDIAEANLPASIQALGQVEREAVIEATGQRRKALRAQISALSKDRADYVKATVKETDKRESFERKVHDTLARQAAEIGLEIGAEAHY